MQIALVIIGCDVGYRKGYYHNYLWSNNEIEEVDVNKEDNGSSILWYGSEWISTHKIVNIK